MATQQETAVLSVLLNGEQARNEISDMEKKAEELKRRIKEVGKDSVPGKKFARELVVTNKTVRDLNKHVLEVDRVLNNLSTAKPGELRAALPALNQQLQFSNIERGSEKWKRIRENVRRVKDVYSDVMKTIGITHDRVEEMNGEFKKMDTRTSREALNNPARDAGKSGLPWKKDIPDFVEVGNQINVAPGEDPSDGAVKNIEIRSKEDRPAAIKKPNEISPEHLGSLTLEKISTGKAKTAIDNCKAGLLQAAPAKAAFDKIVELNGKNSNCKVKPAKISAKRIPVSDKNFGQEWPAGSGLTAISGPSLTERIKNGKRP
jgi:hypothetical protein